MMTIEKAPTDSIGIDHTHYPRSSTLLAEEHAIEATPFLIFIA